MSAATRWPDAETGRLLALYDDGLAVAEIAEELGRSTRSVKDKLDRLGERGFQSFWKRRETAFHEAAHAVAAIKRGGVGQRMEITIYPVGHILGQVTRDNPMTSAEDEDFVSFAGPWASARYRWEWDQLHEDDAADFQDYLAYQMEHGSPGDLKAFRRKVYRLRERVPEASKLSEEEAAGLRATGRGWAKSAEEVAKLKPLALAKLAEAEAAEAERNAAWDIELEPLWPVIEKVADALIDGQEVTEAWIQGLLDA